MQNMRSKFSRRNWKLSSQSKLIFETDETGSRGTVKLKTLSSDVNIFIKHITNDINKNT